MKTQFLLEEAEIRDLMAGKKFTLEVGNGTTLVLQAEHPVVFGKIKGKILKYEKEFYEKGTKKRRRKNATPGVRTKILRYAESHGVSRAAAHFRVRPGLITSWRRKGK